MAALHRIGVRHHSPACARLVEATIRSVRPATVLIEGPCDLNDRLGELLLGHEMPVALFSFLRRSDATSRSSWFPLCSYSPEWVAMRVGSELGCELVFMDLPAWHDAFASATNRSADRVDRYAEAVARLCDRTGMVGHDALWDHLFESTDDLAVLAARLARYFEDLRAVSALSDRDAAREHHMRAYVEAALRRGGDTVVVCGGFHSPALDVALPASFDGANSSARPSWPAVPIPADGRPETYLVPYSYRRLDSFAGYESGMPSPAYYEAVHELGVGPAADELLRVATARLRGARQPVSTADLVAVRAQTDGLARLRAHAQPTRVDLLDGLASGLLKDAIEQPIPWERRAPLDPRTHPILTEMVSAFCGDRIGRLHPDTPRPPLLADARAELAASGIAVTTEPTIATFDLGRPKHRRASVTLHRLRVLSIPGFARLDAGLAIAERWQVVDSLDADVALIEASVHGPSLDTAANGRLRTRLYDAVTNRCSDIIVSALVDALHCESQGLPEDALEAAAATIDADPDLGRIGRTIEGLTEVDAALEVIGGHAGRSHLPAQIYRVQTLALTRFLWLLEHVRGPSTAADEGHVEALTSLTRACQRRSVDGALVAGVLTRKANDRNAPPAVRGGCLGALWTLELLPDDAMDEAVKALHSLAPHEQPGDYLGGLFAVARQLVTNDDRLLRAVDHLIDRWTPEEFLTLLPALRRAFAWFPPRERSLIGDRIAALRGLARSTRLTGKLRDEPLLVAAGAVLDARIGERIVNYGLARAVSPSADKQETGPAEVERRKTGPPNVVNSTKRDRW